MLSPTERVNVLHSELSDLERYLSTLSPESWSSPSACDRWTVADVVAHMASAFTNYTGNIARGLQGDTSGPLDPSNWNTASASDRTLLAEAAAQRVVSYRESLGDLLLPTLHQAIDGLNQLLAGMGTQDWDRLCYHGRGEIPARNLVTYAILEACLHRWDIQSKLEDGAELSGEAVGALIEHMPEFMHWTFVKGPDFAEPRRFRFRLTGEVSDEKEIVFDGQARLAENDGRPADAVFQCDAGGFLLLMCGRTNFSDAVARGLLVLEENGGRESTYRDWVQAI